MKRGDVILVRFPHPSGQRGKKRPAVIVQSDTFVSNVSTVVVAEVTKNLTMKDCAGRLHFQQSRRRRSWPKRLCDEARQNGNTLMGFYVPRDSTVGPPKASGPTYKTSKTETPVNG